MARDVIQVYNSLSKQKEVLIPQKRGYIGMYVCGPTVYSDVHLGNCRTFVSFDIVYRYFLHLGYKVRYVRNITDVGHLLDDGEDRMGRGARIEQLEPMEVAQKYTVGFHKMMQIFNTLPPSIEPRATGHIIEQIEMIEQILQRGYAYIVDGSVYFDTIKFIEQRNPYGQLSGRVVEELLAESRDDLKNQEDKRHPSDFALWIKASDEHIMRWSSPWSVGFPGWHLECSAMSTKYLGQTFDIHGGGSDLKFPHHENEIAQNIGACGCHPAKYWLHANMLLLNGRKMSKSEGNSISPQELFTGNSPHISKRYSPMIFKFFMLQAHYRSTLDITDEGLKAAEKAYLRLFTTVKDLDRLNGGFTESQGIRDHEILSLIEQSYEHMNDDFNVPKTLATLFELAAIVNSVRDGHIARSEFSSAVWYKLKDHMHAFLFDVFGLQNEEEDHSEIIDQLMQLIIDIRASVRDKKDWSTSDLIREKLLAVGIQLKDGKDGTHWTRS